MSLLCLRCGDEKYANHSATAPHTGNFCIEGYLARHPCGNCGTDVEEHEPDAPHPRLKGSSVMCEAADPGEWHEPTYEGGGGSSGGGGASGGW